ncbi:hypothetical protein [Luteolibacter sp. AS25]|uniref:hypothetical protein n=1 Tax=Luteolibacter sp. AS25 TaxID=3135776 RepID=UPI00398B4A42
MKLPASPSSVFAMILLAASPALAQNTQISLAKQSSDEFSSAEQSSFAADKALSGAFQLPAVTKTSGDLSESAPVFVNQDSSTLSPRQTSSKKANNVLDLSVLNETSAYRNANKIKVKVSDRAAQGINAGLAEISAAYKETGAVSDCESVTLSVKYRVEMDPSEVLEIVQAEVSANPNCACEIVKIAILNSGADESLVGDIAEVAITSAPQSMRMISQCAIAAKPEALSSVQAVLAKLDPNSGDSSYSAKDAKSGKDAVASAVSAPPAVPDPLDLPPIPLIPLLPPPLIVTNPNP